MVPLWPSQNSSAIYVHSRIPSTRYGQISLYHMEPVSECGVPMNLVWAPGNAHEPSRQLSTSLPKIMTLATPNPHRYYMVQRVCSWNKVEKCGQMQRNKNRPLFPERWLPCSGEATVCRCFQPLCTVIGRKRCSSQGLKWFIEGKCSCVKGRQKQRILRCCFNMWKGLQRYWEREVGAV